MGALVTSTGSALAVPDWPLSFGGFFPSMLGGVFFEHGHRAAAGTVGLLTLGLAFCLWRWEERRRVRLLGYTAFGLVVAQALLGGLTVLLKLPPAVSIAHACMAQTFFCVIVALAVSTDTKDAAGPAPPLADETFSVLAWTATAAIYLQLLLGAVLRHTGHGLPYHVVMAGMVLLLIGGVLARADRSEAVVFDHALLLLGIVVLQLALGLSVLMTGRSVWVTAAHVGVGALTLASSLMLSLKSGWPHGRWKSYLELTKPRITLMVLMTAFGGFFLSRPDVFRSASSLRLLLHMLAGLALVVGGANGLNQYWERELDALMRRTKGRPLPQKRMAPREALVFCLLITAAGLSELTLTVNHLSGFLAWLAVVLYVCVYTPLKRKTFLSTLVGAVPGAMPPVIGWAAGGGQPGTVAALLFSILFLWQLPHFLAIAWIYREDYGRAGFPMLPVLDPQGGRTSRHIIFWCLVLLPVSLLPSFLGLAGIAYFFGALALGLGLLGFGISLAVSRSPSGARRLFLASDIYLPALFALMLFGMVIP
jgi:protoheme IX farnesyltransferase